VSCSSFYIGCTLWRRRPQAQPGRMPCLATLMGDLHGAHWEWEVRSPRSGLKMGRVPSFGSMRPPSPTGSQSSSVTARTVILRLNTRWQQCFVPCLSPQADAELAIVRGIAEVSSSRRGIFFLPWHWEARYIRGVQNAQITGLCEGRRFGYDMEPNVSVPHINHARRHTMILEDARNLGNKEKVQRHMR
jgi:hypothetical protein